MSRSRFTLLVLGLGLWAMAPGSAMAGITSLSTTTPAPTSATSPATTPSPATEAPAPLTATQLLGRPPGTIVNGTSPVTIELSGPPAPGSPTPTFSPTVAGAWATSGDSESFTAASTLQPCSTYEMTVWSNTTATGHSRLGHRQTLALKVACPPLAGIQQALARLGYLGATFRPTYHFVEHRGAESRREAAVNAYHPPRGMLAPDPAAAPPVKMGSLDATTRGALTVYQADNHLQATGEANVSTWDSILYAESHNRRDPHPYTWVTVSESLPETLVLYRGHRAVLSTPVNTGVPGAETELGIFPIYSRLVSTTMTGTDPDGTHYVAPDVPWVNYFNGGDAVHGYPRASYGFPQSNGCVELPIETAHTVFDMLAIGDIVEVR
jgi:L,D-transpeptidase catalytic domain